MSRFGKCQNLNGCLLAYRGEETEVEDGEPFICAECGKALVEITRPSAIWLRYVYGLLVLATLAVGAVFAFPELRAFLPKKKSHDPATPAPAAQVAEPAPPPEEYIPPRATPVTPSAPAAEPPAVVTAPARIDLDATRGENQQVKSEVLTRIDAMPGVSSGNKDRLYHSVERARSMGKVLTIPFGSGKSELSSADIQTLKTEMEKPEVARLRDDPTAVFVILGYADPVGDPKKNLAISQTRAEVVLQAMRDKCGIVNVMHPVAMGGSKLLDAQNLEKNRIVEVWAVLP